jgi:hypothetical protein
MTDPIETALSHAKERLSSLVKEREKIEKEIVDWKRVVDTLSVVAESENFELPSDLELPIGFAGKKATVKFTDAVRQVMKNIHGTISAPQVRDQLMAIGFDFSKYKQELVPVHNTLRRLEEQGEARAVKNENGQIIGYRRIDSLERALSEKFHEKNK